MQCLRARGKVYHQRARKLYRPFEEDFYDKVHAYREAFTYEKALRKRSMWAEPLFAEIRVQCKQSKSFDALGGTAENIGEAVADSVENIPFIGETPGNVVDQMDGSSSPWG